MSETRTCPGYGCEAPLRDEFLCRKCQGRAERALGDLCALTRDLEVTVARLDKAQRNASSRGVADLDWRGSDHALAQNPWPADVLTAQRGRDVLALLFEWADFVAGRNHMTGLPVLAAYRPLTELVPQAVAVLLHCTDWMRTDEQGPDLANAIHSVRRELRQLVDCRPERAYAGPCMADLDYPPELGYLCGLRLFRQWGADEIVCDGHKPNSESGQRYTTGCGSTHATTARLEWLRAEVEGQLLPLRIIWEDLHDLIPDCQVDWETAKRWTRERRERVPLRDKHGQPLRDRNGRERVQIRVTPPRLDPQGWIGDVPLYRGSDVLRLAEDRDVRRGRKRIRRVKVA